MGRPSPIGAFSCKNGGYGWRRRTLLRSRRRIDRKRAAVLFVARSAARLFGVHARPYGEARARYERAEAAYPGYWLVSEYLAELLGAEGRHAEAIDILKGISPGSGRPDLQQAIGELYETSGQADRAHHSYQKALQDICHRRNAARCISTTTSRITTPTSPKMEPRR